ncbi:hypothetical protein EDF22_0650 [Rathayibacter sp. PhB127]|uniref:hypothetical protein n=1 Tax=Rathayibacter sp. PhB127 TaxID=2485176 RepID=UPI000F4BB45A|nr:hypothetical protein [Rathayibacter sp. PhB127]ROS28918.1 hypothetical protein EDF22_0650 [Rathayibacter sp. PhB127]
MSEIDFDFTEFDALAAKLGTVPSAARSNLRKAMEVTARHVKDDWRQKVTGSPGLPGLAGAVSYDVKSDSSSRSAIEAEIGYDKGRFQGPFGAISEYGAANEFGTPLHAPRNYGSAALAENVADLERGIDIALQQAEKAAGL